MPTNYSGRFTVIALCIVVSLLAIFWPAVTQPKMAFDPSVPFSKKTGLRPGIDMVGGTSLLYEIKAAPGAVPGDDLANQMMAALKKRVDPDGVRNLIWRPQGTNRLEIQLPLSSQSGSADAKRTALLTAREKLEDTNIRHAADVIDSVEQKNGRTRAELATLAQGSAARQALFDELVKTYDAIQAAEKAKDAEAQAKAELKYDELKSRIAESNVTVTEVESALNSKDRDAKLARMKAGQPAVVPATQASATAPASQPTAAFPARAAAIDAYVKAYDEFQGVRNQIDDAVELKRLLRGSGVLEFHILAVSPSMARGNEPVNATDEEVNAMIERLQKEGPTPKAGDRMRWFPVDQSKERDFGRPTVTYNDQPYVLAWITEDKSLDQRPGRSKWGLVDARPEPDQFGKQVVAFTFDPQGAVYFGDLTGKNIDFPLAIMLDNKVISAPNINSRITASGTITGGGRGGFSWSELNYLVRTLKAGSLPAQLAEEPISEHVVGPQLGADNLRNGLTACVVGLIVVCTFLISYYFLAGVVAAFAVLLNTLLILGVMAAWPGATITLPGLAGIVLTIGTAVDANVLIFERLREEQLRGLSLNMALRNAYSRAFSAILDSNVTTAITAAVLYAFGTEEVKGFGLTLMIGLVCSLFTALFVTKTILGAMVERFGITKLNSFPLKFPNWNRFLHPNVDWMGKAWLFLGFSIVFLAIGIGAFGVKMARGQMFDIEFTKGTSVQFELNDNAFGPDVKDPLAEVRKLVETESRSNPDLPSPNVTSVGADGKTFELVTPNDKGPAVRDAIVHALGARLKVELPSTFDQQGVDLESAMAKGAVVPITSVDQKLPGINLNPAELSPHVGGAAIVLKDLSPVLTADQIKDRLQRQKLAPQNASATSGGPAGNEAIDYAMDVKEAPVASDAKQTTAVVLISSPSFVYDAADPLKQQQWRDTLVRPVWTLVNDAVARPAKLQRVTNIDAQVAGETTRDAITALILSIGVIMAYIWIRFGNLKYGTATVLALIHDALATIAAIGVSHVLANTFIGDLLLLQPFRVNLTIVAAVLTVMGYSMIDTIVVFDRIRENRGKFGLVSRKIINDAINQTMSRTVLTASTTIVMVAIMYIKGGGGIHGFTFALLIGILVGTYSSIAIAAPFLLLGQKAQVEAGESASSSSSRRSAGQLQRA